MLYLFDLDDTLIRGYLSEPRQPYDVVEILPKRKAKLNQLVMRGDTCCIITNQGSVGLGLVTFEQADRKLNTALRQLGLAPVRSSGDPIPPQIYACFSHERGKPPWNDPADVARRKPSGAMLREAIEDHPYDAGLGVLYVGDRPEDEAAAKDAGVAFQWAHVFFDTPNYNELWW